MTNRSTAEDHQIQQDLSWCVTSAPLMDFPNDNRWPSPQWFQKWPYAQSRADIPVEFPDGYQKLGIRFETMMAAWINAEPSLALVAANLPVRDGGLTLGEFDLLVNHAGVTEHWELAIKFYLRTGDGKDAATWHGPNPSDTLYKKVSRLRTHQLLMSQKPAAQSLLASYNWKVQRVRCLLKGRLFHPWEAWNSGDITVPDTVNKDHERGWWITAQDFAESAAFTPSQFAVLEKAHWLAPINATLVECLSHAAMVQQVISMQDQPAGTPGTLHVAEFDTQGHEISRGFIVFPAWLTDVAKG